MLLTMQDKLVFGSVFQEEEFHLAASIIHERVSYNKLPSMVRIIASPLATAVIHMIDFHCKTLYYNINIIWMRIYH